MVQAKTKKRRIDPIEEEVSLRKERQRQLIMQDEEIHFLKKKEIEIKIDTAKKEQHLQLRLLDLKIEKAELKVKLLKSKTLELQK